VSSRNANQEREQFEQQVRNLARAEKEAQRAAVAASAEAARLDQERLAVLAEMARGVNGVKAKASKLTADIEAKHREADQQRELAKMAKKEHRKADRELKDSLCANLGHWIKEAGKLTDQAMDARQRVLDVISEAELSEGTARAEWNILRNAVSSQQAFEEIESQGEPMTVQRGFQDLGQLPPPALDPKFVQGLKDAPRPEPASVRKAKTQRVVDVLIPTAVKRLFRAGQREVVREKEELVS
jgi:hypothetical protein